MPRTISDEEYAYLQGRRQVADFVEPVYNNPNLNKEAKRLLKKHYPQLQIPDLDIEERVDQRFEEERRQRDEAEAARRQAEETAAWQRQRKATQDEYGATDEAMEDLERFMVEKNIGDYSVAAHYKFRKDPKVSNGDFNTGRWDLDKQAGFAEIAKDPEGWGRNELLKAMQIDEDRARGR